MVPKLREFVDAEGRFPDAQARSAHERKLAAWAQKIRVLHRTNGLTGQQRLEVESVSGLVVARFLARPQTSGHEAALHEARVEFNAAMLLDPAQRNRRIRHLQRKWHPDKNPSNEVATSVFQMVGHWRRERGM